jgi:hypothetical protein
LKILGEVLAGRACVGVNEKELDVRKKKSRRKEKGEVGIQKRGPVGHNPQSNRLRATPLFSQFFYFLALFFGCYEDGPGILGERVYNTSIF